MSEFLGSLPGDEEEGAPAERRAPGSGAPTPSQAVQLGLDFGDLRWSLDGVRSKVDETRSEVRELRGQQESILAQQQEHGEDLADLRSGMTEFGESLDRINAALEANDSEEPDTGPQEPAPGWVHVPTEDRAAWLGNLQVWVRDVLFVQWPHTQTRLRWCWPLHMDIVSDLAILRRGYVKGFEDEERRFADAEHFRRTMDNLLRQAEELTAKCPEALGRGAHPVPSDQGRDDVDVLRFVPFLPQLFKARELVKKGDEHLNSADDPNTPDERKAEHEGHAAELQRQAVEIVHSAGLTADQWETFTALFQDGREPGEDQG